MNGIKAQTGHLVKVNFPFALHEGELGSGITSLIVNLNPRWSGQLHVLAAVYVKKGPVVCIEWKVWLGHSSRYGHCRSEKFLGPAGNRTMIPQFNL